MPVTLHEIIQARDRIAPHLRLTEVSEVTLHDKTLWLKLETQQITGSFKARGSLNKVLTLNEEERRSGVITASTGNHGLGVANACRVAEVDGTVYLPASTRPSKLAKLHASGISLELLDTDALSVELIAKEKARSAGKVWISPYNDPAVIAGQGTIGLELLEQLPGLSRVFVTVGGGGLISGISTAIKAWRPEVRVIGCLPRNSPEMYLSVQAGNIVHLEESLYTLSDGSAGGLEDGSITFGICQRLIDHWVLIAEEDIARAMRLIYQTWDMRIEGSAGVAVAAALGSTNETGQSAVVVCGGNIDEDKFLSAISESRTDDTH